MGLAVKNPEVNGEHAENKDVKGEPKKYSIRIHDCHFSFKLRKHARRRPARTSAKDMREEWKLDSQDLKSAVRVDEKGPAADARKKRQFGCAATGGFCPLVLVRIRCGGHEIFSLRRFCRTCSSRSSEEKSSSAAAPEFD